MRRLLLAVALLAVLLVGADRGTALVAERVVAVQAQRSGGLAARPSVDVRGFPFLTQALRGRYDDVHLSAPGGIGDGDLEQLDVDLRGVRVPLRTALSGRVDAVPVDALQGSALLSYALLSRRAPSGLRVSADGDRLRVQGSVTVLGQTLRAAASSTVRLSGDRVLVRAQQVLTGAAAADALLTRALGDRFDFSVPVGRLPYGLRLTGLQVQPGGLAVRAEGGRAVLRG